MVAATPALSITLTEALDDPALEWESSGEWTGVEDSDSHDGVDAARAVAVSGSSEHRLATTVTGPGVLSLWWSVPESNDEGRIHFKVDGRNVIGQGLEFAGWEQLSVNVPAGQHTIAVVVEPTGRPVTTLVDQASWSPGQRLPAAVAVGDPDGFWVQKGVWERTAGAARDGTGDAATVQAGDSSRVQLLRLLDTPSVVRYWHKIETDTPDSYFGPEGLQTPGVWVQSSEVVTSSGTTDKPLFGFGLTGYSPGRPAKAFLDDVEIRPLTLTEAVDLPASSSPEFTVSPGATPWQVYWVEADRRRNGSIIASPGLTHSYAEMKANFEGPGLLTWSWTSVGGTQVEKRMTVSVRDIVLGEFGDDLDNLQGFAHAGRELTGEGTNTVLWRLEWGGNPYNPSGLDDILFSVRATAAMKEAIEIDTPLFTTAATPWTSQTAVTHDGTDALELAVASDSGRQALTLPVTGPGVLSWWWRSDVPENAAFRVHRQGREISSLNGSTAWRKEHLVVRTGVEYVRWEYFPGSTPAGPAHRVWLDEVKFTPQNTTIGEALEAPGRTWTAFGEVLSCNLPAPASHDGTDALVLTGPHTYDIDFRPTSVETSIAGPGVLTFRARIQRERTDYTAPIIIMEIDGDGDFRPFAASAASGAWGLYGIAVPGGVHTVRWKPNAGTILTLDEVSYAYGDGYNLWAQSAIPSGQPALHGDDPDGDGVPNMLEYATGSNPLDGTSTGAPAARLLPNGRVEVTFVRDLRHADVILSLETSADLTEWFPVTGFSVTQQDFLETVRITLPPGVPFVRLKGTKVP